ncbi:thioesterase family protein (plasmid) [Sphingomonas paeninsulae]|uniref:Thioesterase family protein n=1 Tax=Sphingomonas paeninsulae TaxID=2319844 RepID=A0A494TJ09_SPHPE|nr:thioesterase family protein [Sphingomonas paeninsulae]AYJ85125.1 thioesterase family protein [Sphingomonas paeninsulae]
MNNDRTTPEAYFHPSAGGYIPTEAAASPWDGAHLSGVAIGGLLAHAIDGVSGEMSIARLTIDILGTAPRVETTVAVRTLREGNRLRLVEAELSSGGRVSGRATALLVRVAETPAIESPLAYPPPESFPSAKPPSSPALANAIQRRIVYGSSRDPGPGAMWVRIDIAMVAGTPLSPLVRSAMMGDMGGAIGSVLPVRGFTFANVDIAIHFSRMPRGEWLLIDSLTDTAGNGLGIVSSVFSDRDGVYARGHQALFVSPR